MGHKIGFPDTRGWPPLRNELFVPELIVPVLSPASLKYKFLDSYFRLFVLWIGNENYNKTMKIMI